MTTLTVVDDVALKQRVQRRLIEGIDHATGTPDELRAKLRELLRDEEPLLATARFERVLGELVDEVGGLGPLEPFLADASITEVMVNGPGRAYVERNGQLEPVALDLDVAAIVRLVERVVAPLGLRLDRASPMVDARLPDGSRLHAVIPPLAVDGPCVTIRRFGARAVPLDAFGLGAHAAAFLEWVVGAGWNVLVAGGTSAGKTTLLNALSAGIPSGERIVTIEETAELRLAQPHVVRLEARPANAEGAGEVSVRSLVRAALRMRPDRVVVGEVRGGEALDMLQALNTGHEGSMSTIHANGAADALARLETLTLLADSGLPLAAVRTQLAASVDAVVHVARAAREGSAGSRRSPRSSTTRPSTVTARVSACSSRSAPEGSARFVLPSGRRGGPECPPPSAGGSNADGRGRVRRPARVFRPRDRGAACVGCRSPARDAHPRPLADPEPRPPTARAGAVRRRHRARARSRDRALAHRRARGADDQRSRSHRAWRCPPRSGRCWPGPPGSGSLGRAGSSASSSRSPARWSRSPPSFAAAARWLVRSNGSQPATRWSPPTSGASTPAPRSGCR